MNYVCNTYQIFSKDIKDIMSMISIFIITEYNCNRNIVHNNVKRLFVNYYTINETQLFIISNLLFILTLLSFCPLESSYI